MNTIIESEEILIPERQENLLVFLRDLRNHELLMPDQVRGFKASEKACSYEIQGTGNLSLERTNEGTDFVVLAPVGKSPFPFMLTWKFTQIEGGCLTKAVLEADMNVFIKSVAFKPLKNFLDLQIRNFGRKYT